MSPLHGADPSTPPRAYALSERPTDPEIHPVFWAMEYAYSRETWWRRVRSWVAVRVARMAWRIAP